MADENFLTCTFRILRYVPNLVRDEWINIGVLLVDPEGRLHARMLQEEADFARLRRLFPAADVALLRGLEADFEARAAQPGEGAGLVAGLEETLSNALQLGPQKAVLTVNAEAELERLFHDQVEPAVYRAAGTMEREPNRAVIRRRARDIFKRAQLNGRLRFGVKVEEFTAAGDPFRLDFGWENGTRGFLHSVSLARDPGQAKVLAFTAAAVREKMPAAEFAAITEVAPQRGNRRHEFAVNLLEGSGIQVVPLTGLDDYARRLRGRLN
ncbi:MAG TPA: DUF3037 domain-containing protein [Candidatus Acidoferrales bacterium]|nr:DUF3037 domain-containing protein [Candidatus Acidoferrales bacterium]